MKVTINHDGVNVHLFIKPETSGIGKVAILAVNLIGLIILGIGIADWLLGLIAMSAVWLSFCGWFTLWNMFGKEMVIINTKSLSFQHTYGFYVTPLETHRINRALNISLVPALQQEGKPRYNLVFESFNDNDLPEELYRTALSVSDEELEHLKRMIRRLYFEKVNLKHFNQPHLMN